MVVHNITAAHTCKHEVRQLSSNNSLRNACHSACNAAFGRRRIVLAVQMVVTCFLPLYRVLEACFLAHSTVNVVFDNSN